MGNIKRNDQAHILQSPASLVCCVACDLGAFVEIEGGALCRKKAVSCTQIYRPSFQEVTAIGYHQI